jgi:hypothetical protein
MMISKVFVNRENMATFICPKCESPKTKDVTSFIGLERQVKVKVKCPCGNSYSVMLERRHHFRKKVELRGIFLIDGEDREVPMKVTSLSRSGLDFSVIGKPWIKPGDILMVDFALDNKEQSKIRKKVRVKNLNVLREREFSVGAEFCFLDEYDKILGFYLF